MWGIEEELEIKLDDFDRAKVQKKGDEIRIGQSKRTSKDSTLAHFLLAVTLFLTGLQLDFRRGNAIEISQSTEWNSNKKIFYS